jgi:hypothetical protein
VKKDKSQKPARTWPRTLAVLLAVIVIVFAAADAYFNGWKTITRLWNWNILELRENKTSVVHLKANRDFRIIPISDARTIADADSLAAFDKPYRESGYYRIYFRSSDSASAQLQKMYLALSKYDTSGAVLRSLEDTKRAFRNIQALLGIDSAHVRDTVARKTDSTNRVSETSLGEDDETSVAMRKILGTPQVILGVGVGLALSAGSDLLKGNAYCAVAENDVFHIDSIKVGAKVGTWQGDSIDVVWAFRKTANQ